MQRRYDLRVTTQGPLYPPSEVMDGEGNFVVIGNLNTSDGEQLRTQWGAALVSADTAVPAFGRIAPYSVVRTLDLDSLGDDAGRVLHTLPLPLPCNNYEILFAPEQCPDARKTCRNSLPLHRAVPDYRPEHCRQHDAPITLGDWVRAKGMLTVTSCADGISVEFLLEMSGLIPKSLYTVMALREGDLEPRRLTRPGPLGVPNCFVSDRDGGGRYCATMRPPPVESGLEPNRIINVVVLFMSTQCSYGGAIGWHGLGGDIHAQLKCATPALMEHSAQQRTR
jgi:hypothetical protein